LKKLTASDIRTTERNSRYFLVSAIFILLQYVVIPKNIPIIVYIIADAPTVGISYMARKEAAKEITIINAESNHLFTNFSIVRNMLMKAKEFINKCIIPECWNI
jgi:hypothetical protein